jgi:uncharacterized protein (TIGR04222 family)
VNPFDLRGPAFLGFYALLAAVVIGGLAVVRWRLESGPVPKLREVDPYLVAYLRAGPEEVLRVVVMSLLDRKLLRDEGAGILVAVAGATKRVRRQIERSVLHEFAQPMLAAGVIPILRASRSCDELRDELRRLKLIPDDPAMGRRFVVGLAGLIVLWMVAVTKIEIAFTRGHRNIGFLIVLAFLASFVAVAVLSAHRTTIGSRVLDDLEELFRGLRERAQPIAAGGATNEFALLLGVFGAVALAGEARRTASLLFPAPSSDSGGGGCGSSCGGGCGGGGCGGCGS